jgi:regulator of protease activity HflC (stomatin/prohibitin superfamily)
MTMLIGSYNGLTGEQIVREATDEEIAERQAEIELAEAEAQAQAEAQAEKESAKIALLERLGITDDEAKLLLA